MDAQEETASNEEPVYVEKPQQDEADYMITDESAETKHKNTNNSEVDRGPFIHGLAVGLGIGCVATFVIVWISVFFTPHMPYVSYETLLSVFIFPLIYLLAVGLIALTAGIVREYYSHRSRY
jgi:threonine/homoserine/homoserine lactone efflux protein